jgi:hypothetical protein
MRRFEYARLLLIAALAAGAIVAQTQAPTAPNHGDRKHGEEDGFTDTPLLPGLPWHVHDPARPHPPVVTPGAAPGAPPSDAVVLFDGHDLSKWTAARLGKASYMRANVSASWKVENGYFEVVPGSGDIATRENFGDVQLHAEWMEPAGITGLSQNRGNSGFFLMGLFEIQVLDSYRNQTYADGQAGAMYGQWPPLANATKPPGQWQIYDIVFEAPRFAGGKLEKPASMTVFLNGVLLHNRREEMGPTIYREVPKYEPGPSEGPLILQDHGSAVRFRNIWLRRLAHYDQPDK